MSADEYMKERQQILDSCKIGIWNDIISSHMSENTESLANEPACKELFNEFLEEKKQDFKNLDWILDSLETAKADIANGVEELCELKRLILLTKMKFQWQDTRPRFAKTSYLKKRPWVKTAVGEKLTGTKRPKTRGNRIK